ncbi:hypothetical protein SAMN02745866_00905 [Alteromonadaceae bacterium Bs31]|nr:hypothetical protein SAMN02745866_00905 [Alteromonadaceae bacterium Bs31]
MTDDEAKQELENLAKKYLVGSPDYDRLIDVINDKSRPGLPVRGILEEIGKYESCEFTEDEKNLIEDLLYMFG